MRRLRDTWRRAIRFLDHRNRRSDEIRLHLLQSLRRTSELLDHSESTDWASLSVPEVATRLRGAISALEKASQPSREQLRMLFAPTGDVQEIAIANGWGDEMIELSKAVDAFADEGRLG